MAKATKQLEVQKFVKGQLAEAQKRWAALESEANKAVKNLVAKGTESRKELEGLFSKLQTVELSKRANDASTGLKKKLDGLQTRVVEAAGVASQSQVKALSRELGKLSRKLDSLAGKKGKPEARV